MSVTVRARHLTKTYQDGVRRVEVLKGVDLTVEPGEMVAIVGPSGSGKSTLLHLLGALDRPDRGSVEVAGVRLEQCDEAQLTEVRRRHVGFVFQSFHLLPELSGAENVLLAARLGQAGAAGEARARELIDSLGLN